MFTRIDDTDPIKTDIQDNGNLTLDNDTRHPAKSHQSPLTTPTDQVEDNDENLNSGNLNNDFNRRCNKELIDYHHPLTKLKIINNCVEPCRTTNFEVKLENRHDDEVKKEKPSTLKPNLVSKGKGKSNTSLKSNYKVNRKCIYACNCFG